MINLKTIVLSLASSCLLLVAGQKISRAADPAAPTPQPKINVVAFYNATYDAAHINFDHEANIWFPKQAQKFNFTYTATKDWNNLNKDFLSHYQVVMFLDDSPKNPSQRAAFQSYMENGGGFLGFHVSAFSTKASEWPWYFNTFLGSGRFNDNTWFPTSILLKNEAPTHPAMKNLPPTFTSAKSEWYSWTNDLAKNPDITILASVDPSSFPVGTDPKQSWTKGYYPIIWSNKKFKMIYANFGHNAMDYKNNLGKSSTFDSPNQNQFLLNAILWLGSPSAPTK